MMKKLYVKTYGCQMNVYDSDKMQELLAPLGYQPSDVPDDADMVILNTCHIREKASEKVFSELGRLRVLKEKKKKDGGYMFMTVAGCVAQAEGEEIVKRAPFVDMVVGPQTYHRLPEMLAKAQRMLDKQQAYAADYKKRAAEFAELHANNNVPEDQKKPHPIKKPVQSGMRLLDTDFPVESKFDYLAKPKEFSQVSTFLSIQEGCDKFCTFCVVPYTRGAEFSRPAADILKEAKRMADAGVREITLLGQNVNAYHGEAPSSNGADAQKEWSLADLIYRVADIDGIDRIRYTTSHPRDMDENLARAHGDVPALMPFLHLPFQSGSDRILKAMNRKHTQKEYRHYVDRLLHHRPDLILSTDIIVGFPGENDRDFEDTMQLVRDITFPQSFSFKYSPRPGTPASVMDFQIPIKVQNRRLQELQALLTQQMHDYNRATIGKTLPVLLEKPALKPGQLVGRTPYFQPCHVELDDKEIGNIIDVQITEVVGNCLIGKTASTSEVL